MPLNARLYFVHALSPLHAGTGQGIGAIDLPIARERATHLPYFPGSGVKGALRDLCRRDPTYKAKESNIFGPDTNNASDYAGSVILSDLRLLLLPVRSLAGTFAWVTSPYLLRRLMRDAGDAGQTPPPLPEPPAMSKNEVQCLTIPNAAIRLTAGQQTRVYLEDLDLTPRELTVAEGETHPVAAWAKWLAPLIWPHDQEWQTMLPERLCIVPDDVLGFLAATAIEVIPRIRLEPTAKTVDTGGLWYEEALPTESVLAGLAAATEVKATAKEVFDALEALSRDALQLGGKATIGRGLCRLSFPAPQSPASPQKNGQEK
ncbi:MAG TPA: type III-B CRISPR module RAMP protein Cmr4 [Caldilineaceae bacterium]|nr:type III-B CRISPR module RAMP protein Cmr4 [Caldilineaceae bacterium]